MAFVFGVCAALALAPFYLVPLIIPAYAGLFLLLEGVSCKKRAFADGWWWGWGFYIAGLYWFCIALLTDVEKFAWAIPFCLFGLNAVIALYPALACLLFFMLRPQVKSGKPFVCLLFVFVWFFVEYARGHLFSGFPWNLSGYSFGFSEISLQLASVLGVYGLTFFAVILGASVALIRDNKWFVFGVYALFFASLVWGYFRLQGAEDGKETGAVLRLVQANIKQHHKWNPDLQHKNLEEYIKLTQSAGGERVTHVIWPETAVPYPMRSDTPLTRYLGSVLPTSAILITGTLRMEGWEQEAQFYNSIVAINKDGKIIGNYDKHALVPFGEFLPLRFLIPKSLKLPVGDKDFSTGTGTQTVSWSGLPPVVPLICYEVIFPEFAADGNNRSQWLLNLTNDAWFGISSGPYQHFEMARMRAVEQGLPLIRVANTGITAYIDEYGRIRKKTALGEQGVIDVDLRQSSISSTTYTRFGELGVFLIGCILITIAAINKILIKN